MSSWRPSLGAWWDGTRMCLRVWAPERKSVEVILEANGSTGKAHLLEKGPDGFFAGSIAEARPGTRYRYLLDGEGPYPDPASRFQPEGVHGSSQVVDANRFAWSDCRWTGVRLKDLVLYELHAGTFTPSGTFVGIIDKLPYLVDLGVTAIELMPVADFPGQRNWGYDGVSLFAPARCYGEPDDLRHLVNEAHGAGLAIFLDVVYNHLGPDGNYLGVFSPYYFSTRHKTPWGPAINLDGENSGPVRDFLIESALHWIYEYHIDGLRLDATHALVDHSPRHLLAELSNQVRAAVSHRNVLLIAEDHRNLAHIVRDECEGGWGMDAVWADDLHHQIRCGLAGDNEGYYCDFSGSTEDLVTTMRQGWFFCGQHSHCMQAPRGTDPAGLPASRFITCIQNHDQIGNRAFGERLNQQIPLASYRAATLLLLLAPQTPLLFMGQEWAAETPFLFFTDHHRNLGKAVTAGRRYEFRHFSAFSDPAKREEIPDPQALETFMASQLRWQELPREPHVSMHRFYQALLSLRRSEPALQERSPESFDGAAFGQGAVVLKRTARSGSSLLAVIQWREPGVVDLAAESVARLLLHKDRWETLLHSEEPRFAPDPEPPLIDLSESAPVISFRRASAVLLRSRG